MFKIQALLVSIKIGNLELSFLFLYSFNFHISFQLNFYYNYSQSPPIENSYFNVFCDGINIDVQFTAFWRNYMFIHINSLQCEKNMFMEK
jgi:hypothetical protein